MKVFNRQKLLAILLIFLIAAPSASGATGPVLASQPGTGAVVLGTRALNIRECPDLSCNQLGSAPLGAQVKIVGETVSGFSPVEWKDQAGWAYDLFLFGSGEDRFVRHGIPGCNRVAIIFNAGIGESPSASVLNTLIETGAPATLFAMGWWAEAYPHYLKAMDDAGIVIGSHGDTQTFLTDATDPVIRNEVRASADRIESVIGKSPLRYYTPYASDSDARVRRIIADEGYLPVGWSVSAGDYHANDTAQGVHDRVMTDLTDGAIIELHLDGPSTGQSTALALPRIIADLEAQGFQLVTIPEIILPCTSG